MGAPPGLWRARYTCPPLSTWTDMRLHRANYFEARAADQAVAQAAAQAAASMEAAAHPQHAPPPNPHDRARAPPTRG